MKNIALSILSLLSLTLAAPAMAASPSVSIQSVNTPYGTFSCKQRAQNKLFSMGATGVSNLSSGSIIWGYIGDNTAGVWCRGIEAIIVVSGTSDSGSIRDEISQAF